jgi:hypothetical protein
VCNPVFLCGYINNRHTQDTRKTHARHTQDRRRTHLERLLVETERGVGGRLGNRDDDWQHLAILHLRNGPFAGKLTTEFAPHLAARARGTSDCHTHGLFTQPCSTLVKVNQRLSLTRRGDLLRHVLAEDTRIGARKVHVLHTGVQPQIRMGVLGSDAHLAMRVCLRSVLKARERCEIDDASPSHTASQR